MWREEHLEGGVKYNMSETKNNFEGCTMSLEAARVNAKLTLEQACEALGITKATLISYEKGRTYPTIDLALKMCELYKISINLINFLS